MIESYKDAIEEYKRVDHLFFVTLKYTRTVDVIRSVIDRLITTFEHGIDALLICWKEEKIIDEIPASPVAKGQIAKERCDESEVCQYIDIYLKLRKLRRQEYTKREEFRRHVTMVTELDGEPFNVDIDLLKEYYEQTGIFLKHIKNKIEPYREDD